MSRLPSLRPKQVTIFSSHSQEQYYVSSQGNPPRRPTQGVIFDMDGTITDTRSYHMEAWWKLTEKLGLGEREFQIAQRAFGKTNWAIFKHWFEGQPRMGRTFDKLSAEKEALFRELIKGRQAPREGVHDLLAALERRGMRIALATSGPKENAEFLLQEAGITPYFHAVVWGSASLRSKPDPAPFLEAAKRLGLPPQRCVVVEDSVHGFWAARRGGMGLIAVAERSQDILLCKQWTRWVYEDFRKMGNCPLLQPAA